MLLEPFKGSSVVIRIDLPRIQSESRIIAGYRNRTRAEMGIEYLISGLRKLIEEPSIKSYGLLGRMDLSLRSVIESEDRSRLIIGSPSHLPS